MARYHVTFEGFELDGTVINAVYNINVNGKNCLAKAEVELTWQDRVRIAAQLAVKIRVTPTDFANHSQYEAMAGTLTCWFNDNCKEDKDGKDSKPVAKPKPSEGDTGKVAPKPKRQARRVSKRTQKASGDGA